MKKLFTLIITISIIFSAKAEGLNSLFDKAIRNGRSDNGKGAYSVQFDNKNISVDNVLQFMLQKDYILTDNYSTKRMLRFGTYVKAMAKVDFIPKSELESFIANIPQAKAIGKAIVYPNSKKETVDVYWSGNVKDGWITGNSIGYTKLNNNMYIIKGNFENGISKGNCEIVTATPQIGSDHGVKRLSNTERKRASYSVGHPCNGYQSLHMNNKYGFINEKGDIVISCLYGKIIQDFNNSGVAIVTDPSDNNQEIKINTKGSKLGYSDNQLRINEEKRQAKIAEERRIAEEKRKKELKDQEEKFYNELIFSINDNYQKFVDNIYEYIRRFPDGAHIDKVRAYKNAIEEEMEEVKKNKNSKLWSKGDKICYHDTNKGLVCGVLESWNEKKTKAKLKILSGHIYNGQTTMIIGGEPVYKDKDIWIGIKDGWHLAVDNELRQLAQWENLQGSGGVGGGGNNNGDPKLNCVGRQIYWEEQVAYNIGNGGQGLLGSILSSALGTDRVTYTVRYTAIVEAVIGETSVKCIITNATIMDPSWASVNYVKYKKQAAAAILEDVGKTRVKQLNEFKLL